MQGFIDRHTTVSTERTVLRLLGVDGVDDVESPLPNVVVDAIKDGGGLSRGAAYWIGNAMIQTGLSPQEIAERVAAGSLDLIKLPTASPKEAEDKIMPAVLEALEKIKAQTAKREKYLATIGEGRQPYLYVIVATGNIYEDIVQAQAAARQGADVIAVIRTTAQSLLDYVPYGPTTEGFGGTYATQENFRLMRKALDDVGEDIGRYIRLCNYSSGMCMPEIAAMGALERLDVMLNDALYGILFRDINMQRTLVDQFFSRIIIGYCKIIFNSGEDNYLTTADAYDEAHTVLASQFINEQFAVLAKIPEEQMGLGHAFEMDPELENGFLYELSQALMAREIFPKAPLKYMPPTKFMTGNIFRGHIQDALFNLVSVWSGQSIQLLGMLTEAIHTPHLQDRMLSIENASYIFNNARALGDEVEYKQDGIIQKRAQSVLAEAERLLLEIEKEGLFSTIEQGKFGGVKRPRDGGKGLAGVCVKDDQYFNPFIPLMLGGAK
jgi:beta-lysine 5,6-aminomutase alpha subunit